jgi:hypothetical protein
MGSRGTWARLMMSCRNLGWRLASVLSLVAMGFDIVFSNSVPSFATGSIISSYSGGGYLAPAFSASAFRPLAVFGIWEIARSTVMAATEAVVEIGRPGLGDSEQVFQSCSRFVVYPSPFSPVSQSRVLFGQLS